MTNVFVRYVYMDAIYSDVFFTYSTKISSDVALTYKSCNDLYCTINLYWSEMPLLRKFIAQTLGKVLQEYKQA